MGMSRIIVCFLLLAIALCWCGTECKMLGNRTVINDDLILRRDRRMVDVLGILGFAMSLTSFIQGFTSEDPIEKIEELKKQLDAIQKDITTIKDDVAGIWQDSKEKWYFDEIEHKNSLRKQILDDIKEKDDSQAAQDRKDRFVTEVLGGHGNDQYVEKALFHIHELITDDEFVPHYYSVQIKKGKTTTEAAKLTWMLLKKLFQFQTDGYASVILASAMKYEDDEKSYRSMVRDVCTWWPKESDTSFKEACAKFGSSSTSVERRKDQQDYLFGYRNLAVYPAQQVKKVCNNFNGADGLHYAGGNLFVSQKQAKNILVVDPENLKVLKTLSLPGAQCGGNCHPFDVSVNAEHKMMVVAAHSQVNGGRSYVLLYKISGDLEEPSSLSISFHHKVINIGSKADVRGAAFCGDRIAYADYDGKIVNLGMDWSGSNPEPSYFRNCYWHTKRDRYGITRQKIYYFGCSTDSKNWVVERTNYGQESDGAAAVSVDITQNADDVFAIASATATKKDWSDIAQRDGTSRLNRMQGIAMDSKKNLFYTSNQIFGNGVSGIYQRRFDGVRRFTREWEEKPFNHMKLFDIEVDGSGFLYVIQKVANQGKCLHKYYYEIDVEDTVIP